MHGHDGLDLLRALQCLFEPLWVDAQERGLDIDEHWRRTRSRDDAGRSEERIRRQQHFVPWADAECHERAQQRIGAGRHRKGMGTPEVGAELLLEALDLGSEDVLAASDDGADDGFDLGELCLVAAQVDHWHGHGRAG